MDLGVRQSLQEAIEKLTHSGAPVLDQALLKKVKTLCKQHSDPCIRAAYQMVTLDLAENHAEVRLSAFQVINELFTRSNLFRELLISDFKMFSSLVTGMDPLSPLPPPRDTAEKLKKTSLLAIKEWNHRYGRGYPKLKLGYNYLKFNRKVDFVELVAQNQAQRRRREERDLHQQAILQQRIQEVKQEMVSLKQEIEASLIEVESCFNLLLPRFEMPDIYKSTEAYADSALLKPPPTCMRSRTASLSGGSGLEDDDIISDKHSLNEVSSSDSDSSVEWEDVVLDDMACGMELQEHGMVSHGFSIPVEVKDCVEVVETDDNSSILVTLREIKHQLIYHYIPTLNKCLEWMVKASEQDTILQIIDMKNRISAILTKYNKLQLIFKTGSPDDDDIDDDVEVNSCIPTPQVTDPEWKFGSSVLESVPLVDVELDPTTPHAQLKNLKKKIKVLVTPPLSPPTLPSSEKTSSSVTSDLLSLAPVVPFGMDLYHWSQPSSHVEPRTLATMGSLHRFWAEEREVNISQDEQNRLKCRTISFPGQFKPVMTSCRAKLLNGNLCPRMDRYKCPFHGNIIPRDDHGNPVKTNEQGHTSPPTCHPSPPLWQDEQLRGSVMVVKGIDLHHRLHSTEKKKTRKGKKKVKHPGLTDLNVTMDTPRKRLERKVLSKRSLKRVADTEDKLVTKKYTDKFGNNFNYAIKN